MPKFSATPLQTFASSYFIFHKATGFWNSYNNTSNYLLVLQHLKAASPKLPWQETQYLALTLIKSIFYLITLYVSPWSQPLNIMTSFR